MKKNPLKMDSWLTFFIVSMHQGCCPWQDIQWRLHSWLEPRRKKKREKKNLSGIPKSFLEFWQLTIRMTPPPNANHSAEDESLPSLWRDPMDVVQEQTEKGVKFHSVYSAKPCQFQEAAQVRTERRDIVNIHAHVIRAYKCLCAYVTTCLSRHTQ